MTGFALIFGTCTWVPPSGKAAVVAILYFFGVQPSEDIFRDTIVEQYVAGGMTESAAAAEVVKLEDCFNTWEPPAKEEP